MEAVPNVNAQANQGQANQGQANQGQANQLQNSTANAPQP